MALIKPDEISSIIKSKIENYDLQSEVSNTGTVIEIGDGIAVTSSNGSTDNDGFTVKDGEIIKTSNHAGGIMGGISDGSEIILRAHIKPTPSISQPQQTVTKDKEPLSLEIHGRHDPVIVPRAVVVVESMAAITLADALFVNMSSQMDKVRDFYRK